MPASLDDILTAQKNGVIALNNIQQALAAEVGTFTTSTVSTATFIVAGKGRLLRFSVVVAGSTNGLIHNYNNPVPTGPNTTNALVACPNTVGVYEVNLVFDSGLVIVPGTGQSLNITYLLG
jgi:hypothetical protein